MSRKRFLTLEEALEYAFSEEIERDILLLPPEVDDLTDEELANDEEVGPPAITDTPGDVEMFIEESQEITVPNEPNGSNSSKEAVESLYDSEDDLPLSTIQRAKRPKKAQWEKSDPIYDHQTLENQVQKNFEAAKESMTDITPVKLFEQFFDEEVYNLIMTETHRYAKVQKNRHNFEVSREKITVFIGFLIFSGYHTLPSERDYWSDAEDLGIPVVKNAFSRNTYREIKSVIHLQTTQPPKQINMINLSKLEDF